MNYLSAESVSKSFSDKWLFKNVSIGISKGERVALVGINGSGKSTLLNILAGTLLPDEGKVSTRKEITVGYLGQHPQFEEEKTVLDTLFSSKNPALEAVKLYEQALEGTANIDEAIEKMDAMKAWDYESKIKQIMGKLGIHDLDKPVKYLSGGQRKRVAMARVLIEQPDLLIMDEPTNHLDLETIEWLENLIATQQQTLLLVTHDRYFLDRVANEIVEITNGQLYRYKGNYSYFLEKKAERELAQEAETDKAKNLMRKELEWMRRQPKARGTKSKSRIDAFYDLKDKASRQNTNATMELSVKTTRQGGKIIEVEKLNKSFGNQPLVKDFSYVFKKLDKIGIIGKNGVGKTTFLNMLTGKLQPDSGSIDAGSTTTFGYYTQDDFQFREDQRVIDVVLEIAEVVSLANGQTVTASQFLQYFQFNGPMQYSFVSKLSGGEKRRLQLLKVLIKNPNFLILDEPTNDLDIVTLNILEDFLQNFPGCLLIVSHDRYFMDQLVEHLFVFEGEGKIRDFPGNYTDYREWLEEEKGQKESPLAKNAPVHPVTKQEIASPSGKRKISFKEKQEYEQLEKEIDALETEKKKLIIKLNAGSANHQELSQWASHIEEIDRKLAVKSDRWLELGERM
ncbi:ABC-F family ATP-binding cassette domain-containing protein [Rhodocytophaga rosea]|uniref:ABC-F family ATP-binding cassette domain-containing protein n=1 Tax=Rhodocytophaga rosea TaxID=2704465 RepID=A0A6C0GMB3_9BACT|nr:ABC-F family ATP-binding cassette domain-containing protein [Rhodocytophaga rosea]QHT69178.1 ABC-F family ATP-binding cassette domain-containing protein [Rhodocytophaga rosea]